MKYTKLLPLFIVTLLSISLVLAAGGDVGIDSLTITAPTASETVSGSYTFSGTYVGNSSGNITVFYNSSDWQATKTVVCTDTIVATDNCDSSLTYKVGVNNPSGYKSTNRSSAESEFSDGDIIEIGTLTAIV